MDCCHRNMDFLSEIRNFVVGALDALPVRPVLPNSHLKAIRKHY